MDSQSAIATINRLVLAKEGRELEPIEIAVLQAAWEDCNYEQVASNSDYSVASLQRRVAPKLWAFLTGVLGSGQKVTKKRLRSVLERLVEETDVVTDVTDKISAAKIQNPAWCGLHGEETSPRPASAKSKIQNPIAVGQMPGVTNFCGRQQELTALKQSLCQQRCVVLLGVAGIGKSSLAAKAIEDLSAAPQPEFERAIWKSLAYPLSLPDLVRDLLQILASSLGLEPDLPSNPHQRLACLLEHLRSHRTLIVLDGADAILQDSDRRRPPYQEKYADYGAFFRRLIEEQPGCLLLTSRHRFGDLDLLEKSRPIRSLTLDGLDASAGLEFLRSQGLTDEEKCLELIQTYRGHPAYLEALVGRIHHFFGGSIEQYFQYRTTFVNEAVLEREFGGLSQIHWQVTLYLAQEISTHPRPIAVSQLLKAKERIGAISTSQVLAALEVLESRSLIEFSPDPTTREATYTLPPVVKKYVLTHPKGAIRAPHTLREC